MPTDPVQELADSLRKSAAGSPARSAAVDLLIWHEFWLRRRDFNDKCIRAASDGAYVDWRAAAELADTAHASSSEVAVLKIAAAIGSDTLNFSCFGSVHCRRVAEAFAAALGVGVPQ